MKNLILVLLLFVGISYASAQDVYTSSGKPGYHKKMKKKKGYDPERLIIGGGLTANFGGGYANAGISPLVGYRITDKFSAGIGLGYLYAQVPVQDYSTYSISFIRENIVYPNIWTRYFVYRNFFVSGAVEYDFINLRQPSYDPISGNPTTEKLNVTNTCLFLGGGLKMPLGGRVYLFAEMLYDVLQGTNSPYIPGFPTDIRVGFAAGL